MLHPLLAETPPAETPLIAQGVHLRVPARNGTIRCSTVRIIGWR